MHRYRVNDDQPELSRNDQSEADSSYVFRLAQ